MGKSYKEILDDEGLIEVDRPLAPFGSDALKGAFPARSDSAPSIAAGKLKSKKTLADAAADAFRNAATSADAAPSTGGLADAAVGGANDVKLVRVRPKTPSADNASAGDKVVVVSKSRGKVIGRQG